MKRKEKISVIVVSLLLLSYAVLILFQQWLLVANLFFIISPIVIGWLVYNVLKNGEFEGKELGKDEEWRYADNKELHSVITDGR
jgi:hypothetical protein